MPAKYLFDECLGKPMMEKLQGIVPDNPHFEHICSKFVSGALDKDWIPGLAKEGGWIILSSDRGMKSGSEDKLPVLCAQHGITHVLLSNKLHHKSSHEKVSAIAMVWAEIAALEQETPGSRFVLRYKELRGGRRVVVLEKRE